jgi:hypothetical protein
MIVVSFVDESVKYKNDVESAEDRVIGGEAREVNVTMETWDPSKS